MSIKTTHYVKRSKAIELISSALYNGLSDEQLGYVLDTMHEESHPFNNYWVRPDDDPVFELGDEADCPIFY